ncbi:hypothetical protein KJ039_07065 [bacterium]|nr:hypothetical protein [bacterium]
MPIRHIGFQNLLYRKFISPGEHDAKKVAGAIGESLSTFYNYCEGAHYCPPDLVGRIYNATGDLDFLNFILADTDHLPAPRQGAKEHRGLIGETLDVAASVGRFIADVQAMTADNHLSEMEKGYLCRRIEQVQAQLEEARLALKCPKGRLG